MIIATVRNGKATRRYAVVSRDDLFTGTPDGPVEPKISWPDGAHWSTFGGRWVRKGGLDEAYRSLSLSDVVRVKRVDPSTFARCSCGCGAL